MTQFLEFIQEANVSNYIDGPNLININLIRTIEQTNADTVIMSLGLPNSSLNELELKFSTTKAFPGVSPVFAEPIAIREAFNKALISSPGTKTRLKVQLPKDDNGNQVYCVDYAYS